MHGRLAEAAAIAALATAIVLAIAAPVLVAPSDRLFGMETVGRHHDPFTVMQQFEQPIRLGVYSQPVTDITGALIARVSGPVAAYNWLVLLSFPLSAVTAYLLARHLALSPAAAAIAALAFAFSPFHLAHAAYHPHVAQTQWIPLYLLALWRCLDAATPKAVTLLAAATFTVTLSNFYGGLIAAAITPAAMGAYWFFISRPRAGSLRQLALTVSTLVLIGACGLMYAVYVAQPLFRNPGAFAVTRNDVVNHSATWSSYLVPPVQNPWLGEAAQRFWERAGVGAGLLEQQVSLGWGIMALGLVAAGWALRNARRSSPVVPVVIIVGLAGFACSTSRASSLFHDALPMFRAYARFGVIVQLMAALLAGIGVDYLRRTGLAGARMVAAVLVCLAAVEYTVVPSAMWRHALPTAAHRWITVQPGAMRVLDCMPLNRKSASIQWLTGERVAMATASATDCAEPNFPQKLAATGFTHLLERHDADGRHWRAPGESRGLRVAATFDDAHVFAVTSPVPAVYTAAMTGFFRREHDARWTWRWIASDAAWTIVNTSAQPVVAMLEIELQAFHRERQLVLAFSDRSTQTVMVGRRRRLYTIGPLLLQPGPGKVAFRPAGEATQAAAVLKNGDTRALSIAVGRWNWTTRDPQP